MRRRPLRGVLFIVAAAAHNTEPMTRDLDIADVVAQPFDDERQLSSIALHDHRALEFGTAFAWQSPTSPFRILRGDPILTHASGGSPASRPASHHGSWD
jgi:hypothetical protein